MNDNYRALYDAVSGIDPALIEEASAPPAVKKFPLRRIASIAACLALIAALMLHKPTVGPEGGYVSAPGILAVTAYAFEDGNNFTEVPLEYTSSPLFEHGYCPLGLNCVPGHPISFHVPDGEDMTLDISVNEGHIFDWHCDIVDGYFVVRDGDSIRAQNVTITEDMTLYWRNFYDDPVTGESSAFFPFKGYDNIVNTDPKTGEVSAVFHNGTRMENIYIDIIIRSGEHITGYAVIHMKPYYDGAFQSVVIESVSYPQVDGEYQDIPQEYVDAQIRNAKLNNQDPLSANS